MAIRKIGAPREALPKTSTEAARKKKKRSGRTDGGYLVRHELPSRSQRRADAAAERQYLPSGWIICGRDAKGKLVMRKATARVVPRGLVRRRRRLARASRRANRSG